LPTPTHTGASKAVFELLGTTFDHPAANGPTSITQVLILHMVTIVAEVGGGRREGGLDVGIGIGAGRLREVVRNLTRSSKAVWVPAVAGPTGGRLLLLEPNETRILSASAPRLDPSTPNHHQNSRPQD